MFMTFITFLIVLYVTIVKIEVFPIFFLNILLRKIISFKLDWRVGERSEQDGSALLVYIVYMKEQIISL